MVQKRDRVLAVVSLSRRVNGKGTATSLNSNINPIVGKANPQRPRVIDCFTNCMRLVGNADVIAFHP